MIDRLLRLIAYLVPAARRDAWLREWRAELAYLRREKGEVPDGTHGVGVHLLDALEDAVGMRRRNPGSTGVERDLKYALRTLTRRPLFALVVVVTLALGIGANTAIFSVLYGTLLRPLPYRDPDGLVVLAMTFRHGDGEPHPGAASEPEYLDLKKEAGAFRDLVAFARSDFNLGGVNDPERVAGAWVSADFLGTLGVSPALGRGFLPGEDRPGAEAVVVVSHGLWERALGGDPGALGTTITLNDRPYRVVGVLPPEFVFPVGHADLLVPEVIDPANLGNRSSHYLQLLARTAPGIDPPAAQVRLDDLLRRWALAYPGRHDPNLSWHPIEVVSLRDHMVGNARASLILAMGAVALVLLIACANVANLMLVRAEGRRHEMALRRALGAGRGDLVRQLLIESLILGLMGALGGLAVGAGGLKLVNAAGGAFLAGFRGGTHMDGPVLAFTLALGVIASVAFGLGTAILAGQTRAGSILSRGESRATAAGGRMALRRTLVVAEVGTAVLLVVGAGLLLRSLARLQGVDPGFDPRGVVVASFSLSSTSYPEAADVTSFHRELKRRLEAVPGFEAAGAIRVLPLRDGDVPIESLSLMGRTRTPDDPPWVAGYQVVNPGYFKTLRIPLLRGRLLDWSDEGGAVPAAVINGAMARAFWSGGDPLGRRFRLGPEEAGNPVLTVVGVVGDVRQSGLTRPSDPQFFVPRAQAAAIYGGLGTRYATVVVRSDASTEAALRAVRQAVRGVDPQLPVAGASSMEGVVTRAQGDTRSLGLVLAAFSGLALILGAVGIYGLMAYTVARRTREIGVRIALGAGRGQVVGGVLRQALALAGLGAVLGVAGALAGSRILENLLYGVGTRDPVAFAVAPAVLLAVALLASFLPARRAAAIDPSEALRQE